jgi:hypothetical protein
MISVMENNTESRNEQINRQIHEQIHELKEKIEAIFSKEKLNEIQQSITASIGETQEKFGSKIDAEVKKTLKGTMQFLNGAKGELEGIQKRIRKLMGGTPKKKVAKKAAGKSGKKVKKPVAKSNAKAKSRTKVRA